MSLACVDAEDRARQLLALTERLTQRLKEECAAFEARKPHLVALGSQETIRLANLYRHEAARVRQDPGLLEGADREIRRRLIDATRAFQAVLERHGRTVDAARTLTEGLVGAIAREVAARRSRGVGYGPTARRPPGDACAITLNRRA